MTFDRSFRLLAVLCLLMAWPASGLAQEATLSGSVKDPSGGVLPGVTVTAIHEATGNTFLAVTDETGAFRLPVRTGSFQLVIELEGFASAKRRLELLVGQTAVVALELVPATIETAITVTGDAPLINPTSSTLGSNVDPRQMRELPLNGRNFVDLTMLAPGSRQNASSDELGGIGTFQLNMDGLRVTQNQTGGFGQPKFSRDAIAEFEFVSNRFDATQGGSSGTLVNAITKSGTNSFAGTFSGYFRDDNFVGKDFIQDRVLPYSDQQYSWTGGGPIIRNRAHFFLNYEYEREPQTFSHSSPYPTFNFDLTGTRTEQKGGGRIDVQFTANSRMTLRGNKSLVNMPYDSRYTGGATRHPSSSITTERHSTDFSGIFTQVLGNTTLNEGRVGYQGYYWIQDSIVPWGNHPYPGLTYGAPIITLRGYTIGQAHAFSHEDERQDTYSFKDTLMFSMAKGGRHDFKVGGEWIYQQNPVFLCLRCMGSYDAQGGAIPANIESLFPVWNDVNTWNLAAISPIVRSYTLGIGQMKQYAPMENFSAFIQDDWHLTDKLTLNVGLRYDLQDGVYAETTALEPFMHAGRKNDTNNWGPRFGAAYSLNDKTVLRGGAGRYFADPGSHTAYWSLLNANAMLTQTFNDGRANFAASPFNGPTPGYDQVLANLCVVPVTSTCYRRTTLTSLAVEGNEIPYSDQASIGMQKQLTDSMSFDADYIYNGNRSMLVTLNANLAYNPATGYTYPYSNLTLRPYKEWGDVNVRRTIGESDYHALQLGFTKRMKDRWQASATYLLAGQWNLQNAPVAGPGCQYPTSLGPSGEPVCDVPIDLHPSLVEEWYLSGDQRHRFTINGIWDVGWGFQASGLYLFGDNGWATPTSGVDVLQGGTTNTRVRPDGTLIPRNSFDLPSMHRVDVRLQRRFRFGRVAVDGIAEVFNVFNHENYGAFVTNESNSRYGQPTEVVNTAYQPIMLQLGFRASF